MIGWAVEALAASAVLMVVVLLARQPVRRVFGPQLAYALWALPLLRLVLPPLPAAWSEPAALPIARASEVVTVLVGAEPVAAPVVAAAAPAATLPWGAIVAAAWLAGAAIFFLLHSIRHRRFCRRLLTDARLLDRVDGVCVIETPAASGPLAFGMARRFVAFPHDFADRYDADERELALAHELGHHARGDLIANWIALAVLALHWFNPLAWHAFRAFRCDQELANDARVLAGRSRADRHVYACAILKAAHGGAISAACHLHTITDLKGRLRMLSNTRLSRARRTTGAAALIGAIAGGLIVTASGTQAAAALSAKVESATGVQIAAPPTPPAAPAVPVTAPAAPAVPAVPAAPAARAVAAVPATPPTPAAPVTRTRTARHVVIVKDGKTTRYDGDAAAAYIAAHPVPLTPTPPFPPVPTVVNREDCQPVTGAPTMTASGARGQKIIIVCQNRIRQSAALAEQRAEWGRRQAEAAAAQAFQAERRADIAKRNGLQQAVASLRLARRSIESERSLTDEQRRDALAGLAEAERELGSQLRP